MGEGYAAIQRGGGEGVWKVMAREGLPYISIDFFQNT